MEDDRSIEQQPESQEPEGEESTPPAPEELPPPMLGSAGTTEQAKRNRSATEQGFMARIRSKFR